MSTMFRARLASAVLAAVAAALGAAPPAALADALPVRHYAASVTDLTGGGVVAPGDTVEIVEQVRNVGALPLPGLRGTLSSTRASVTQAVADYGELAVNGVAQNTTPFRAILPSTLECGENVDFSLGLGSLGGAATVGFTVDTGRAGVTRRYPSADVPYTIADGGTVVSTVNVVQPGRVKDVRVKIGTLRHAAVGDLTIALIAPDGTRTVLFNRHGGRGDDLRETTIGTTGQSFAAGAPPYTGAFFSAQLPGLVGKSQQGPWRLEVHDQAAPDAGVLESWSLELNPATCDAGAYAALSATPDVALPGEPVTLSAANSFSPNGPLTYDFDADGDGEFERAGVNDPTLSTSFGDSGRKVVRVRVNDARGTLVGVADATVLVTMPPVAALSVDPKPSFLSGTAATLDAGGSSDPDGEIVRYDWDLDGDGRYDRSTSSASTEATFERAGVVAARVRVTDDVGVSASASVAVNVGDRPPVAGLAEMAGPAIAGDATELDAGASTDPDSAIASYLWELGDGTTATTEEPVLAHTFTQAGRVTVRLTVTDAFRMTDTVTREIVVTRRPVARVTPATASVRPGAAVELDASGSTDPDGTELAYAWDLDADGAFDDAQGARASASYGALGSYAPRVRVTDADGAEATATAVVRVATVRPVPRLVASGNPVTAGSEVRFDASGSADADGRIAGFAWDLDGDGAFELETGATPVAVRRYRDAGTVPVRVRVTDDDGASAVAMVYLAVAPPQPPAAAPADSVPPPSGGAAAATPGSPAPASDGPAAPSTGDASGGSTAPAPGAQAGAPGVDGASAPAAPVGPPVAALTGRAVQRARVVTARGLALGWRSDRAATLQLTATVDAATARRLGLARGRRAVAVGRARVSIGAGTGALSLKLGARTQRALRRAARVPVRVTGTVTDAAGRSRAVQLAIAVRR